MFSVDLNSDLGESFGVYVLGHDEDVMKKLTKSGKLFLRQTSTLSPEKRGQNPPSLEHTGTYTKRAPMFVFVVALSFFHRKKSLILALDGQASGQQ
jgi:hypothetical protein